MAPNDNIKRGNNIMEPLRRSLLQIQAGGSNLGSTELALPAEEEKESIASFDVEVAIEHAKDALQQYENGPSNHESSKFTLATLHPATVLGQQCRLWVSRERIRDELPSSSALVAALRLVAGDYCVVLGVECVVTWS